MKAIFDSGKIQAFYDHYFALTGETSGWPSPEAALAIYHEGANSPIQRWQQFQSVLDVGAGEGHFASYLRDIHGFNGKYTGIEVLPMFYQRSIKLYGEQENSKYILADFLEYDFGSEKFDWVISLGSLSVLQNRQYEHDLAVSRKIVHLAICGFSIYINDPKDTPTEHRKHTPGLAYHEPPAFITLLKRELGIQNTTAVSFSTGNDGWGTMIHASLK